LAWYLLTIFCVVTINFLLPRLMPDDPIGAILHTGTRQSVGAEAKSRADLSRYYGLDRPLVAQYGSYLGKLAHGDLGVSIVHGTPVRRLLLGRLPWTLLLSGSALVLSLLGMIAGVHSGWKRGRRLDQGLLGLFLTLPNFSEILLAPMALLLFSVKLGWFPLTGGRTAFASLTPWGEVVDIVHHLVLPASLLTLQFASGMFLVMRASMVQELGSDYLLLGRAKGLSESHLKYHYAARNALLPVATVFTLQVGIAISITIIIERVFSYPGVGLLLFNAISSRDYPIIQGCLLLTSMVIIVANFLAELSYHRLDPRTAV